MCICAWVHITAHFGSEMVIITAIIKTDSLLSYLYRANQCVATFSKECVLIIRRCLRSFEKNAFVFLTFFNLFTHDSFLTHKHISTICAKPISQAFLPGTANSIEGSPQHRHSSSMIQPHQ